jgi:alkylated DNA repair dioxygenase AlkB
MSSSSQSSLHDALSVSQLALFDDEAVGPSGLRYVPGFISAADEQELIAGITALPMQPFQFGAFEGHRRVKSFGFRYDYTLQKLQPSEPIPEWLERTTREVERFGELPPGNVRQVLCTEYDVGVGIGWHRDKPHFEKVFGISLDSACRFRFRRRKGNKEGDKWERFTLLAEPRSIYLMDGESRRDWEHSIPPVERRRYSITFRTMRG